MSVAVEKVSVSFSGTKVLKDVSLEIPDGKIWGILGANGSGKSTLIKVLTGIYHPDAGQETRIKIGDSICSDITDSGKAYEMGVRAVHQESPLIEDFTVAECVSAFHGYPKGRAGIDWNAVEEYAHEILSIYDIDVDINCMVRDLSAAQRNMIAIAIAIGREEDLKNVKLLILDESDASIPESEAEFFLDRVKKVAARGIPIIMITHRLKSVMKYCDAVTVLNDGKNIFSRNISEVSEEMIITHMLRQDEDGAERKSDEGGNLQGLWKLLKIKEHYEPGKCIMDVKNLACKNLKDCTFNLCSGEVLGIVGTADSGISEIPWLLAGARSRTGGEITVDGKKFPVRMTSGKALKRGVALLPSDRPKYGGIMECSLRENILMPAERRYWRHGKLAKQAVQMMQAVFDIQPADSYERKFGVMSGGNQQKAIMAKWMSLKPKVFVLDDPTYGVDPNSRKMLFERIKEAAEEGMGIIVFSTEPELLADICTRVIMIREGRVSGELRKKDGVLERETIARWSYL